jgi:hypothetical protein
MMLKWMMPGLESRYYGDFDLICRESELGLDTTAQFLACRHPLLEDRVEASPFAVVVDIARRRQKAGDAAAR